MMLLGFAKGVQKKAPVAVAVTVDQQTATER
jgi:hypothetical protein